MDKKDLKNELKKALKKSKPRLVFEGEEHNWSSGWGCNRLHIVETRPSFRTVKIAGIKIETIKKMCFCNDPDCRQADEVKVGEEVFTLAMPYMQYYWLRGGHVRVTWSLKPLENASQKIGIPLIPNVYPLHAGICMGNFTCNNAVDVCHGFWNTVFTPQEATWYYSGNERGTSKLLEDTPLKSFSHWHELSGKASEPLEVFEGFKFPHKYTYHNLKRNQSA
jgi:hypothetical protein